MDMTIHNIEYGTKGEYAKICLTVYDSGDMINKLFKGKPQAKP